MDFNNAEQFNEFELIPDKTIAPVTLSIKPGGDFEDMALTKSKTSDNKYLKCEFIIMEGPYAKRRFWNNIMTTTPQGMSTLRAILESARNIRPDDQSEAAKKARNINGWQDFNGMSFWAKIKIERDKEYGDRNRLAAPITPDRKEYGGPLNQYMPGAQPGQYATHAPAPASYPQSATVPPWENQQPQQPQNNGPTPSWARP